MTQYLKEEFGRKIVPGNSFIRIEHKMGGFTMRYYFLGGFADDGRVHVHEYGGVPRTIKSPSQYSDTLILLTEDLMKLKNLNPVFTAAEVVNIATTPAAKKSRAKKSAPLEL